jgi:hypothetical protein
MIFAKDIFKETKNENHTFLAGMSIFIVLSCPVSASVL